MEWLQREWAEGADAGDPLCMRAEWIEASGPLVCTHCGAAIQPGELFFLAGRCAMGGTVTSAAARLYSDVLEPEAEHVRCSEAASTAPDPPR